MDLIDKNGLRIDDIWHYPGAPDQPEDLARTVTPLTEWTASGATQDRRPGGIWITADQDLVEIENALPHVELIVIEFPKSRDGRGFTLARVLRERYQFSGDIRAAGPLLPDQFCFLLQCGFTSLLGASSAPLARWREAALSCTSTATRPRTLLERLGSANNGVTAIVQPDPGSAR